jgi:hypothetical protein
MGNSLHNKIPLGRTSVFDSRPVRAALLVSACLTIGLLFMVISNFR